jgi:hypothetical protein
MATPERLRIVGGAVHDPANNVDVLSPTCRPARQRSTSEA